MNKIWMVYFTKGEKEKIIKQAKKSFNLENITISKSMLFNHIFNYVMQNSDKVKLKNEEIDKALHQEREERFVITKKEPYKSTIQKLTEHYRKKYEDYFKFVNMKAGVSHAIRLAFYEFMKLTGK